jgi:hypothetical protein
MLFNAANRVSIISLPGFRELFRLRSANKIFNYGYGSRMFCRFNAEILANFLRHQVFDFGVLRNDRHFAIVGIRPYRIPAPSRTSLHPLALNFRSNALHTSKGTSSKSATAILRASSTRNSRMSWTASRRLISSSSLARSCALAPGTSSTQPSYQLPSFSIIAVYSAFIACAPGNEFQLCIQKKYSWSNP